jgi:hypothetical protein
MGALAIGPAAARADFNDHNTCIGHISQGPKDPLGLNTNPVAYKFACAFPVTGYSIISDKSVDAWETEVFVADHTNLQVIGTEAFSCNGAQPGWSVNCVGTYTGGWNLIQGTYNLEKDPVCTESRTDPLLVVTYATYAKNANGSPKLDSKGNPTVTTALAGPFDLGRPRGCKASKYSGKTRIPKETPTSPDVPAPPVGSTPSSAPKRRGR